MNTFASVRSTVLVAVAILAQLSLVCQAPAAGQQTKIVAAIEVSPKGVKLGVLKIISSGDGVIQERLHAETNNTTLGVLRDGRLDQGAIDDTVDAIEKALAKAEDRFGVERLAVLVVGSSGLPTTAANFDDLRAAILKKTRKKLLLVTYKEELPLTILGLVPPKQQADGLVLDIGFGKYVKCGYFRAEDRAHVAKFCVADLGPGVGELTRLVRERKPKDSVAFAREADALCRKHIVEEGLFFRERHPGLINRRLVYLNGGAAWMCATYTHAQAAGETTVLLTTAEINRFHDLATKHGGKLPDPDLSSISDATVRTLATSELKAVRDTFSPENVVAAATILKALSAVFDLEDKQKTLVFNRNGYLAWISALLELGEDNKLPASLRP